MAQGTGKGDFEITEKRCLIALRERGLEGEETSCEVSRVGRREGGTGREENISFGGQEWATSPLRSH